MGGMEDVEDDVDDEEVEEVGAASALEEGGAESVEAADGDDSGSDGLLLDVTAEDRASVLDFVDSISEDFVAAVTAATIHCGGGTNSSSALSDCFSVVCFARSCAFTFGFPLSLSSAPGC